MSTSPFFFKAFLGTNGRPAASGWLFAYVAGSSIPKAIYADRNNTILRDNPLRLDGNGIAPQFFTEAGLYDFKVYEYNFVTPESPGPSCYTAEDIDGETGSGGGPAYVLPIATETILGGVKPDGVTTFVDEVTGVLTAPSVDYTLPIATTDTLGGVKPDGTTVQVDGVTGVLSVIPEELTPELAGYAEGGYTEFSWVGQSGDILGQSSFVRGTNLFRIQDFIDGMVLKLRWIGNLDTMNTAQPAFIDGLIGGETMGQFDITPPTTNGDYNVAYEATIYLYSTNVNQTILGIQSRVDFSKNGSDPAAILYSHTRYWSTNPFANGASIPVGMTVYRSVSGGYRQRSLQAWMENAQRSSTPDPALIFQPLEDQRLSTNDSVAFATATARAFRVDTVTPDTTAVIGSTFWDDENKTISTHVANGSILQHGQEVVYHVRNNSGVTIGNGKAVYITGSSGQKATVALASAGDPAKNSVLAVATQEIANNSDGYVTCVGRVNDIDTSAFSQGAELWLSDSVLGGLTATMPSGGSARVHIGHVIRSHATQGSLSVAIERFPYAHELSGSGTTLRTATSTVPSETFLTEHSGTTSDEETLPLATGTHKLKLYVNVGTKAWKLIRSGSDTIYVPDPMATAVETLVYPGNSRWMLDSAPGVWKVVSPGPFLPLYAGEANPVTGQCWFGSPTSSGGIVVRTNTSGTGTTNIDYYGGADGKRRLTLRWSDLADSYTIQTSNDDGSARLDRVKVPRDSARNLIFAGGVGHNVTTRTTTSATSTLAGITRYTGTGGDTEPLPAATVVGEVREYRNSGTGPWTLQRAGSDQIDAGNPSALVTSITLLPGQSTRLYVATVALWEAL